MKKGRKKGGWRGQKWSFRGRASTEVFGIAIFSLRKVSPSSPREQGSRSRMLQLR
jgi:hypothetical protein